MLIASGANSLISIAYAIVTYRKVHNICCIIGAVTPPDSLAWKIPWRVGDLIARTLSIVVFATVHGFWIFFVLSLHWIAVTLLLVIDHIKERHKTKRAAYTIFISSYIHIFLSFNISSGKSKLVAILYYVIFCAESVTLTLLWLLYEDRKELQIPIAATIACCQICAAACTAGYYSFLHKKPREMDLSTTGDSVCYFQCLACRMSDKGHKSQPYHSNHVTVQQKS